MRRVIVDYAKLTQDILNLLVEKFPEGYEESDVIRFKNAQNELIEAVEVRTTDTIYLVKVSKKLATRMEKFEEEDLDAVVDPMVPEKGLDLDDDINEEEEEEVDLLKDKETNFDEDEDDDDDFGSDRLKDDDEDEDED